MKKRVFIISCLICVILSIQPVYAEMHSLSEIRLYGWHVTLEDVENVSLTETCSWKRSEDYEECRVEDAREFLEQTYKSYITDNRYEFLGYYCMGFQFSELDEITVGDDFQIYDVDSIQCAKYNFFLMKDTEYVGVITLGYYNKHWEYVKGNSEHVLWNKMNEFNESVQDVLFYRINNKWYIESEKKCVEAAMHSAENEVYSLEENQFMNMSWREKKKQAEKGMKELVNMTVACKYYNEDDGKQVNYVGGTSTTDKEQKKDTASVAIAGCCILGAGCAGVIIRKRGEKV